MYVKLVHYTARIWWLTALPSIYFKYWCIITYSHMVNCIVWEHHVPLIALSSGIQVTENMLAELKWWDNSVIVLGGACFGLCFVYCSHELNVVGSLLIMSR